MSDLKALFADHIRRLTSGYAAALNDCGYDRVILSSGAADPKSPFDDQSWSLRVTPHFQHWLPLTEAGCMLMIEPGKRPLLHRPALANYWEGETPVEGDHFWGEFDALPRATPASPGPRTAWIGATLGVTVPREQLNPVQLIAKLDALRAIKSEYERACMREANRRAWKGHDALCALFETAPRSEFELHLAYLRTTEQDDSETPYKNIVALGRHAATLHHVHYGRARSQATDSLLVDAGATCFGYHSDITRTSVKGSGAAMETFERMIGGLDALQQTICGRVRVGVEYESLHNAAHELLADLMRDVGLSSASTDELVASGATRKLLPHGLGHSLGLQTHDVGCRPREPESRNPFLRNTSVVTAGQVFTIEPGLYLIDALLDELRQMPIAKAIDWNLIEALYPFGGIRIEDNIAVLEHGIENFTRSAA